MNQRKKLEQLCRYINRPASPTKGSNAIAMGELKPKIQ
jgi:hypothetical protein